MIHSNNNKVVGTPGFTLIEVLLALSIIGLLLVPMFGMQGQTMSRVTRIARLYERMLVGFDFLYQQMIQQDGPKQANKSIERPPATLAYARENLPEQSPVAKQFPHMQRHMVTISWEDDQGAHEERLMHLQFVMPEPKKEQQKEAS